MSNNNEQNNISNDPELMNDLDTENIIDFFPGAHEKLTAVDAAFLLSVSVPTITRMVEDKQICLTKESIKDYIKQNYKHLKPINLTQITPD